MIGVRQLTCAVLLALTPLLTAMGLHCTECNMVLEAGSGEECASLCSALKSIGSLYDVPGLDLSRELKVTLLSEPALHHSARLGCYNSNDDHIAMLSYEAALRTSTTCEPPLGIPMSRVLWHSYLVHEITHALTHRQFRPEVSHQAASEYIASVVQIATLPAMERERILERHADVTGFDEPYEISLSYYLLAPGKFAVNSYLHYLKPQNGPEFIRFLYEHGLPDE